MNMRFTNSLLLLWVGVWQKFLPAEFADQKLLLTRAVRLLTAGLTPGLQFMKYLMSLHASGNH